MANAQSSNSTTHTQSNIPEPEIPVPKYLYRAWSDESNGINRRTCLAPEITRLDPPPQTMMFHGLRVDATGHAGTPKEQLINALQRQPYLYRNPFVFFSSSLPQDVIHAFYKDQKESNVRMTCLNTQTARTPKGERVQFYRVREIMEILEIELTEGHTFEELDFEEVWVTCDIVIPGSGSSIVDFDDLEVDGRNLCRLIPEFAEIRRYSPGVASPIRNLRQYWFTRDDIDCSVRELNLAARLSAVFEPIWSTERHDFVPMHIFAWMLTMKEQGAKLPRLANWLSDHGTPLSAHSQAFVAAEQIDQTYLCEVERYNEIIAEVGLWSVWIDEIEDLDSSILENRIKKRRADYAVKRRSIVKQRKKHRIDWLNGGYKNKVKKGKHRGRANANQSTNEESLFVDQAEESERQSVTSDLPEAESQDIRPIVNRHDESEDVEMPPAQQTPLDQRVEELARQNDHEKEMREGGKEALMDDTVDDDEGVDVDDADEMDDVQNAEDAEDVEMSDA